MGEVEPVTVTVHVGLHPGVEGGARQVRDASVVAFVDGRGRLTGTMGLRVHGAVDLALSPREARRLGAALTALADRLEDAMREEMGEELAAALSENLPAPPDRLRRAGL